MSVRRQHDLERELLLCCARTKASPEVAARLRELAASVEVEWEYLLQLARRHALIPLLYLNLEREGADLVPPPFFAKLKTQYQQNYARNIILTDELCRLIDIFKEAEIDAIRREPQRRFAGHVKFCDPC